MFLFKLLLPLFLDSELLLDIIFLELLILKEEFVLLILLGDKVNVFEFEIFKLSFELFFEFELLLEESNLLTLIFTIEKSSSGLIKLNYIFII